MKLLDYIRGIRSGKEAHRLQKEAMRDPFLADAMDGYDCVGENQEQQIELLRRRITARATRRKKHAAAWSVAASLLIGVCITSYFLFQKNKLPDDVYTTLEALQRDTVLKKVPLIPQLPLHGSQANEKSPLAVNSRKDSAKPPLSEGRRNEQLRAPVVQEEITAEAEMSVTETDSAVAIPEAVSKTESVANHLTAAKTVAVATPIDNKVAAIIADSAAREQLNRAIAQAQAVYNIRGRVTDESGKPIVGATVSVKGTNKGTISDLNGKFVLQPDGNKEIMVNFIGYEPVVLPVDTGREMLIAMNQDKQLMNEVIVVGYGKSDKANLTGAVAHVEQLTLPQPLIGKKAYRKYMRKNMVRPADDECAKVEGEVVLTFHVDEKGRPVNIMVKESLCPSADKEAVRLINEGPDWTIGGKEVTMSVKF